MMDKNEITEKKMVEAEVKETAASNKEGGTQTLPIFRVFFFFLATWSHGAQDNLELPV